MPMTMYCDEAMPRNRSDRGHLCLWLERLYIAGCMPLHGRVPDASITVFNCFRSVCPCVGILLVSRKIDSCFTAVRGLYRALIPMSRRPTEADRHKPIREAGNPLQAASS